MYKGAIYKCDNCGKEIVSDKGLPKEWFQLRLENGSVIFSEDMSDSGCILEGDYCGKECVLNGLKLARYNLEEFILQQK